QKARGAPGGTACALRTNEQRWEIHTRCLTLASRNCCAGCFSDLNQRSTNALRCGTQRSRPLALHASLARVRCGYIKLSEDLFEERQDAARQIPVSRRMLNPRSV